MSTQTPSFGNRIATVADANGAQQPGALGGEQQQQQQPFLLQSGSMGGVVPKPPGTGVYIKMETEDGAGGHTVCFHVIVWFGLHYLPALTAKGTLIRLKFEKHSLCINVLIVKVTCC